MLRRLCALILVIACACAPVLGAFAAVTDEAHASCCCGAKCPCPPTDRGVPPATGVNPAPVATASLERRADARKPVPRVARAPFASFVSGPKNSSALPVRPSAAVRAARAASVALFQAHCSLLI